MNTQGMIPLKENDSKKISDRYQKKTYAKGTTCIYGDTLYRAKADITTAEEWTAAHWEDTNMETIRAEMAAEVSSLNAKFQNVLFDRTQNLIFAVSPEKTSSGFYFSTSIFVGKYSSIELLSASVIGSSGDFKNSLVLNINNGTIDFYTANANLAGKTMVLTLEFAE